MFLSPISHALPYEVETSVQLLIDHAPRHSKQSELSCVTLLLSNHHSIFTHMHTHTHTHTHTHHTHTHTPHTLTLTLATYSYTGVCYTANCDRQLGPWREADPGRTFEGRKMEGKATLKAGMCV